MSASSIPSLVLLVTAAVAWSEPRMITVHPTDNEAELRNPGMGFALHYYDNNPRNYGSRLAAGDLLPDWPGLSFIYLRIPWSFIEPEEGRFNWAVVDTPMQRFAERGLLAGFRFTCSESWMQYATPKWVADAGARGYRFRPGQGIAAGGPFWEPDFDDPVFLEKLDRFLAAAAQRYDGRPDVAFIEVGSFGVWGEGHTWASTRKAYPNSTIERHIDLHLKHFKRTQVAGMDDFLSRPRPEIAWAEGVNERGFDLVLPFDWRGRSFDVLAGLWRPGVKEHSGRLLPRGGAEDRRVRLGRLSIDDQGRPAFAADQTLASKAALAPPAEFAVVGAGIRADWKLHPHSIKILVRFALPVGVPASVRPFVHLVDPDTGQEVFAPRLEKEDAELTRYMVERRLGLRDDSILVAPPPSAYFHAEMAQQIWPQAPVYIESEHYGGSVQRGCWGDGTGFLEAIEDYHASYASIHWWPHEFLEKNRELVRRINLRIGYRFRLLEMSFPESVELGGSLAVRWRWQNAGVAPPYVDYYPAITLKDERGGIVAVWVDDGVNLRQLPVDLHDPESRTFTREFTLPFQLGAGTFDLFVSVGDRLGRPVVALPLDGGDGARRYRVGRVRVIGDYAVHLLEGRVDGGQLILTTEWVIHRPSTWRVAPFVHLDRSGKLVWAGGLPAEADSLKQFNQPGRAQATFTVPLPKLKTGETLRVFAGLYRPDRMGKKDERLTPDVGQSDRRVPLGVVAGEAGKLTFSPE